MRSAMYEKIALIVLILFAVASSGEVSSAEAEVRDADFSDSRSATTFPLPLSHNDQHFTKAKEDQRSIILSTPLLQTRSRQQQPKKPAQKTKRCGTHLRKSRLSLSSEKNLAKKTRNSNVNVRMKTSKGTPYVSTRNIRYSSENSVTTNQTEVKKRDEKETLRRALQDSLKDSQDSTMNVDSQEKPKKCNKFVCYCQEENCMRKPSRTSSLRMLGSPGRVKPGRISYQRPILDARVLRPGSPKWHYEAPHDPRVLGLINSVPMRPQQEITNPAFFAPLLHGVPLVAPHMIGKDGKLIDVAFPYASFEDRPDFTVGDDVHHQRRPIFHQGMQECRYSSESQFDVSTVSTTSAWSNTRTMVSLNEENTTTDFTTLYETTTANYFNGLMNPLTKSNVESKDPIEITEINAAETLPEVSYSSSGTVGEDSLDEQFPIFVTMPGISYVNARTDSETNELNPYYSETTTMSTIMDHSESSTDLFKKTMLPWTSRPDSETENIFDQRMNGLEPTSTSSYEYTRPALTEFYEYVDTTERNYKPNEDYNVRDGNKLSNINKYIPTEKIVKSKIGKVAENTRNKLLGKSKSHGTKVLLDPNYGEGSTTENSLAGENFLYSTIPYKSIEDASNLAMTNVIRGNSWTSAPPFSPRVYEGETITPYYGSMTDRDFKERTANILMESITGTYPWRTTPQLTTARYSNREKTNDDDNKGDLEHTTESLVGITKSSAKGLSFCDNSLLLSSIKRVINNFASRDDLTKAQHLDEDALRAQGKSLLPEILQIPNLRDILSTPRIEDTIVGKVKDILSNVKDKSNLGWSHGAIRNELRRLLDNSHGLHHERNLPPTTVEEHQFNHGQWSTKLVTLPSFHEENSSKLSKAPGRLRENIKDLLRIPAVASQADRQVVRNMILQSLKNNLASKGEGGYDGPKIEDSVILDVLNNVLEILKKSKDMKNASEKGNANYKSKSANDEEDTNMPREMSTRYENEDDYKTEENVGEHIKEISSSIKQFQKDTPVDGTETRTPSYQKVEKLNNNLKILTTCNSADLIKPGRPYEEEAASLIVDLPPRTTTISSTNVGAFHEGTVNVLNSKSTTENVQVQQNNKVRNGESSKHTMTNQQSPKIYQQPVEIPGCTTKDVYTTEGAARNNVLDETEQVGAQYNDTRDSWRTTESMNDNTQVTTASTRSNPPNESNAGIETITIQNEATPLISQSSETSTQESTRESSNYIFRAKQKSSTSKPFIADEVSDETFIAATLAPNLSSSSVDDEPQVDTADFYNESYFDEESYNNEESYNYKENYNDDETTIKNAIDPINKSFPNYEMDPTIMRETNDIGVPPINYYSPNDRILNYVKSHRVDNEDETATSTVSPMRKSSNYAQLSNEVTLNKDPAAATNTKYETELKENVFSPNENTVNDSISYANNCGNRKAEVTVSSSLADANSLPSQQQGFQKGDVIKIHEVTTEVQKTHAKTVYLQPQQFDLEDHSRTNSPAIAYENTNVVSSNDNINRNSDNNDYRNCPSNKKIDNVDNAAETNKDIVSATGLPLEDLSDTLQIFSSPTVSEGSIEQLQRSQLYYINDNVKLPLEIKKLKDGTYALSISKDVCEQILKKKCCVPLQGNVIQSPRLDTRAKDINEDYQSVTQPRSSTTTLRNTLQELEEEAGKELNVYRLSNYRRKRDSIENDSTAIISMPVLDFARKYNLSLDFDEKEMALNELRSSGKIRNFSDSLKQLAKKSEYTQLKDKNLNGYSGRSGLRDENGDKVELKDSMNIKNNHIFGEKVNGLKEADLEKSHENASRSTKVRTLRLRKLEDKDNDQSSVNVKQITNSSKSRNSIPKGTILEEARKFKNNEMKWGDFEIFVKKKGEIPEEIKLIKLKKNEHMDNNEQTKLSVSGIKVLENMSGRPYRYQRNINRSPNKGAEVVNKFLYWLKDLFLNANK